MARKQKSDDPFRWFDSSPEVIRLVVMMYVRYRPFEAALAPRTGGAFLAFACLYNFAVGLCYGAYSAVTLEAIGSGAAATKFNLLSSLSNVPILIVTLVDGWAETKYGATGMLYVEAAIGLSAVAIYAAVVLATRGMTWGSLFRRGSATG